MQHLDEGTLHAVLDGEIESDELVAIEAHLANCPGCRSRLAEARSFREVSDALLTELDAEPALAGAILAEPAGARAYESGPVFAAAAPAPMAPSTQPVKAAPSHPRWIRPLAWAATIVLALGIGQAGRELWRQRAASSAPQVVLAQEESRRQDAAAPEPPPPVTAPSPSQPLAPKTAPSRLLAKRAAPAPSAATTPHNEALESAGAKPSVVQPAPPTPAEPNRQDMAPRKERLASPDRAKSLGEIRTMARAALVPVLAPVTADSAVRVLSGQLKLIDGWVPAQFLSDGHRVRVSYQTSWGLLHLDQWREPNGTIRFELLAPPDMKPDSVSVLRSRVK